MSQLITCPECGAEITVTIDPGEPMVTSGPADVWYPGSPPSIDDLVGCDCYVTMMEYGQPQEWRAYEEEVMERSAGDMEDERDAWGDYLYDLSRDQ